MPSVEGTVVGADAGLIAPDDEVGAAVVLAHERVQEGLPRAGVPHGRDEGREHHPVGQEVAERGFVGPHADLHRHVAVLGRPDQRGGAASCRRSPARTSADTHALDGLGCASGSRQSCASLATRTMPASPRGSARTGPPGRPAAGPRPGSDRQPPRRARRGPGRHPGGRDRSSRTPAPPRPAGRARTPHGPLARRAGCRTHRGARAGPRGC